MKHSCTVHVVRREFASEVTSTDPTVTALIRRVVPSTGREWLPGVGSWLIFGTRVERLLAAFREAGIDVRFAEGTTS